MVNRDDPESCPQCGLKVYFAEEVKALKRKWHRLCFKCVSCKKTMEPGRCTEHQGQLLCQPCHGKLFGPLGLNNPSGAAAAGGDARSCSGGFYTDAFGTVEYQPFQPTQPIRGAQEWTESIFLDPTPARDRFTS
jgi:DNA-directed RNA polymerase subunit RPC12/RpoP